MRWKREPGDLDGKEPRRGNQHPTARRRTGPLPRPFRHQARPAARGGQYDVRLGSPSRHLRLQRATATPRPGLSPQYPGPPDALASSDRCDFRRAPGRGTGASGLEAPQRAARRRRRRSRFSRSASFRPRVGPPAGRERLALFRGASPPRHRRWSGLCRSQRETGSPAIRPGTVCTVESHGPRAVDAEQSRLRVPDRGQATIRRCAEVVVAPGPDPRPLSGRAAVQPKLSTYADLQKRS
jgi:hypothetical protein